MQTNLQHINTLPMPTWRWLGVNEAAFSGQLPEMKEASLQAPSLPQSVTLLNAPPTAAGTIATGMGQEVESFIEANTNAGQLLHIAPGAVPATQLVYRYTLTQNNPSVVDDTVILAEKNSKITLVQVFASQDASPHLHAGRTRIIAQEGSEVYLVQLQLLNGSSTAFCSVGVQAHKNAKVHLTQVELGAQHSFAGSEATLAGQGSHMENNTVYLGGGAQQLDYNYITRHIAPETTSNMQAAGALFGSSGKIYRGTIDFVSGAARSVGHQQENILLFSPKARNRTTPLILCGEENVEGQHAATIGRVDEAKQFYMQTRGLSEDTIKRLMVEAQFSPILAALPGEALQNEVAQRLAQQMAEM